MCSVCYTCRLSITPLIKIFKLINNLCRKALIKYRILKKSNGEPEDSMEEEGSFKFRDHNNKLVVIPKNDWGYHCCYCVRKYKKRFDLKQHIVSHLLRSNKPAYLYICESCDKTFRGEKTLFRHRRLMHSFLCQACGQIFSSEPLCQQHHCSNGKLANKCVVHLLI